MHFVNQGVQESYKLLGSFDFLGNTNKQREKKKQK